jgi:methylphosphotriester-DNA--protein-cysteine methyltransferase
MFHHAQLPQSELIPLLKSGEIFLGGNRQLMIYGTLTCSSGKSMKKSNRVFFANEAEALELGYRPCGHCMQEEYLVWKKGLTVEVTTVLSLLT